MFPLEIMHLLHLLITIYYTCVKARLENLLFKLPLSGGIDCNTDAFTVVPTIAWPVERFLSYQALSQDSH